MAEKQKKRQPRTRAVNVYMSNNTKSKLNELRLKYKVSFSAICSVASRHIIANDLTTLIKHDKDAKYRTKLKPKALTKNPLQTPNEETIYCTNLLFFISDQFKTYFKIMFTDSNADEEEIEKKRLQYYNKFLSDLAKERDYYYDFQAMYRTKVRVEKQYEQDYGHKM